MADTAVEPTVLDKLREQRSKERDELAKVIEARIQVRDAFDEANADDEARTAFLAAEDQYVADVERRERSIRSMTRRVKEESTLAKRRASAARAQRKAAPIGELRSKSEPLTYRADNALTGQYGHGHSYFADLAAIHNRLPNSDVYAARERIDRHAAEMRVEYPKIEAVRARESRKKIEEAMERRILMHGYEDPFRRSQADSPFGVETRTTPGRTDGQGGYFIPPLWLDEFIRGLRPGRVTANLCRAMDLPSGTDVIVMPKLSTLTTVDVQGGDNNPVSNTDWTDTAVVANVKTIAGYSDIGIQLLEQSPYPVDQMVMQDLLADLDKKVDFQLVQGQGSSVGPTYTPSVGGAVTGLYSSAGASNWTSYNTVTWTQGTVTSDKAWNLFSVFGAMASRVATNRFLFDGNFNIVVHPRRAWWFASGTDSNNRPIVESSNFGPFNVAAVEPGSVPAEGLVSQLPWGHRLYASANVPTADTAGGGSAQDVAIGFLQNDAYFFEGQMRTDVFPEVLSGTLGIRFRVYEYVAFLLRYGQGLAIASGSGFAAPQGAVSATTF